MVNIAKANREGFALATAIVALVVVGALVTGGFYAASQEGRVTASVGAAETAFNLAEQGLHELVGRWGLNEYEAIPVGRADTVVDTLRVGSREVGRTTVEVRRMATRLYFLASTGEVLEGGVYAGAKRTLGMVVRTTMLDIKADRAMQALSGVEVGGNSKVSGQDTINAAWASDRCPPKRGMQAGIVAKDTSNVRAGGSGEIVGAPPKVEDSSMTHDSFLNYGDWDYDELAALASKVVAPGANMGSTAPSVGADGACNTADPLNWGAPKAQANPCHFYFPIIHAQGDLTLNGKGSGQGILLVDGNLAIRGGYEFNGIVIVRGKIETGAGGSDVYGTVLVLGENTTEKSKIKDCDEDGCDSKITGNPILNLSSCAVHRAVRYNEDLSRAFPISERNWMDLTAAGMETP